MDQSTLKISVISPVYKAENIVDELVNRLKLHLEQISEHFEIILVEDGSPDNSWGKIVSNSQLDSRVKGIKLSRNFGQHYAITAGLDFCKGEWVIVMDCDLQDRPEEIPNLYAKALEGYDIVFARRAKRQDNFNKKFFSFLFYRLYSYLSGVPQDNTISNFGVYNRKVIDAMKQIREPLRAFSPMVRWVGFKSCAIDVYHDKRLEGVSSYNWKKLISLALDISLAYSDKPLRLVVNTGLFISVAAIIYSLYNLLMVIGGEYRFTDGKILLISVWFLSGLIIFTIGVLGLYIGKIFDVTKNRPLYFLDNKINI